MAYAPLWQVFFHEKGHVANLLPEKDSKQVTVMRSLSLSFFFFFNLGINVQQVN